MAGLYSSCLAEREGRPPRPPRHLPLEAGGGGGPRRPGARSRTGHTSPLATRGSPAGNVTNMPFRHLEITAVFRIWTLSNKGSDLCIPDPNFPNPGTAKFVWILICDDFT
jgi:hypothetical protein